MSGAPRCLNEFKPLGGRVDTLSGSSYMAYDAVTSAIVMLEKFPRPLPANLPTGTGADIPGVIPAVRGDDFAAEKKTDTLPLFVYLDQKRPDAISRIRLICELSEAVAALHSRGLAAGAVALAGLRISLDGRLYISGLLVFAGYLPADGEALINNPSRVFTAPEIITGASGDSRLADRYSLGVAFYVILTGRFPYELQYLTDDEVIAVIDGDPPLPPSRFIRDPICGSLDGLVMALLDRVPAKRPDCRMVIASLNNIRRNDLDALWRLGRIRYLAKLWHRGGERNEYLVNSINSQDQAEIVYCCRRELLSDMEQRFIRRSLAVAARTGMWWLEIPLLMFVLMSIGHDFAQGFSPALNPMGLPFFCFIIWRTTTRFLRRPRCDYSRFYLICELLMAWGYGAYTLFCGIVSSTTFYCAVAMLFFSWGTEVIWKEHLLRRYRRTGIEPGVLNLRRRYWFIDAGIFSFAVVLKFFVDIAPGVLRAVLP